MSSPRGKSFIRFVVRQIQFYGTEIKINEKRGGLVVHSVNRHGLMYGEYRHLYMYIYFITFKSLIFF